MPHRVTLIPGDGIGPELAEATRRVLDATGVEFDWDVHEAGVDVMASTAALRCPTPCSSRSRNTGVALKGPITTPVGTGFRTVNVALRKALDLYACVRPCKSYAGVRSRYDGRRPRDRPREHRGPLRRHRVRGGHATNCAELRDMIKKLSGAADPRGRRHLDQADLDRGHAPHRQFAFDYARANGRRKVTAVHKANIMKYTDGLFLRVAREVAKDYPRHRVRGPHRRQHVHAARAEARAVRRAGAAEPLRRHPLRPRRRAWSAAWASRPGANIGPEAAVFEPPTAARPKYNGQNKVNPTAMMLSGMLMLRHLGERDAADRLEGAIADVIAEGKDVTYDLKPHRDDPTAVGTSQVADAIIAQLQK